MDIVGMLNSPRYDDILLKEAGVQLDRALFPLLVRIDRLGPISVAALADHAGRHPSTVSRQVAKLEALGFVERVGLDEDQRVRATRITTAGRTTAQALAAARSRLFERLLGAWSEADRRDLARLNNALAASMRQLSQNSGGRS